MDWLILATGGVFSGILSGLLGIGGGFIIVSLLVALGYPPIQAVATSSLVIVLSSSTGSFYNGCFKFMASLAKLFWLSLTNAN